MPTHKNTKQYLIEFFVNKHSVLYFDSDADFETIQEAHPEIINQALLR